MLKKTELRRKTPLRSASEPRRKPMKKACRKKNRAVQKDCRWRSEAYLKFVRSLPCCVCGATAGVAAHHIIGMWHLSGASLKAPDSYTMPACDPIYGHVRDCHQQIHAHKALRYQQPAWIKQTIRAAFVAGVSAEAREELSHALAFVEARESQP